MCDFTEYGHFGYPKAAAFADAAVDTPATSINAINQDTNDEYHPQPTVPTHEHTNETDSPTYKIEEPHDRKSEDQDELSFEQSMHDEIDKQVSIGPTTTSDFTTPDANHTDPNHPSVALRQKSRWDTSE
eukprot:g65036.t1